MNKQKRLLTGDDYEIFVDSENRDHAYGMAKEYFQANKELIFEVIQHPQLAGDRCKYGHHAA